ncbi:hydroxyneurosporene methyltransferase [Kibdelosporangium aridum]|uniref:Hydroxyneurosporene methyltransferase n=1 Tax=Kibdelosporangium aridum TaxID=2030 RepID=A0A428Z514_KIBAR|nr:hydroxyneurosporene methyltransferase [Kibdelosporangium aridum]
MVATIGVAEHMDAGITKIDELAQKTNCDAETLARVLRHLVGRGVFEEPADGEFTLNEAARGFLDPVMARAHDLDGHTGRVATAWSGLLAAVRTGRPAYQEVFERSFWEDLEANPHIAADYDLLMGHEGGFVPDAAILVNDDWDNVSHVIDVGGGTGAMLAEILRVHPDVRGTLVDLPRTVAQSGPVFESAGVADRVTVSGQSFFDPLPGGADVYLLKRVVIDWPDDGVVKLLTRCAEAAGPNGRVVVVGGVSAGASAKGGLLTMLVTGGKPRTVEQFRVLADKAGLRITATGDGQAGPVIVECRRK